MCTRPSRVTIGWTCGVPDLLYFLVVPCLCEACYKMYDTVFGVFINAVTVFVNLVLPERAVVWGTRDYYYYYFSIPGCFCSLECLGLLSCMWKKQMRLDKRFQSFFS